MKEDKISVTSGKIEKRIKSIQTGCPYPIVIHEIYQTPLAGKIEQKAHIALSEFNTSGEWFDTSLEKIKHTVCVLIEESQDDKGFEWKPRF